MRDVNNFIAGIKPRTTPDISEIRLTINNIVTRTIPISAKKEVFFNVIFKVCTLCALSTRADEAQTGAIKSASQSNKSKKAIPVGFPNNKETLRLQGVLDCGGLILPLLRIPSHD
jgi:hypothetical protein